MYKLFLLLSLSIFPLAVVTGQDTLAGYASTISGETITYNSYTPLATEALLTRTNTGAMAIEWWTVPVPEDYKGDTVCFAWTGGNASGTATGSARFDLFVNGTFALTIAPGKDYHAAGWQFSGNTGVSVRFMARGRDDNNDLSGEMILRVPKPWFSPGKPLRIKIVGERQDTGDWLMVYQYREDRLFEVQALPLLVQRASGDTLRMLRVSGDNPSDGGTLSLHYAAASGSNSYVLDTLFSLGPGYQEFHWPVPFREGMDWGWVTLGIQDRKPVTDSVLFSPLVPLEIHLVHHSHNDIGYSALQQRVASIQNENIRKAVDLIRKTADYPWAARFRWNVESLWAVENYLDSAGPRETAQFAAALKTGRLSLQALYANELTGLMDGPELKWMTDYSRKLEKTFHIRIRSAMISDVPGYTWSTIAALSDAGIRYFSVGTNNSDRIGGVLRDWADRPFYWLPPGAGKAVLTDIAGSSYSWFHGTPGSADRARLTTRMVGYINRLEEEKYPYRFALVRYNIISDNAPLDTGISDFVRSWNQQYLYPKLVLSTPEIALSRIEATYGTRLPVFRGDLSPYWEDGAASTAGELAWNRGLRSRLEQDAELSKVLNHPLEAATNYKAHRDVVMFDEHTWGAWCSISDPDSDFTRQQWAFKRNFLVEGDSLEKSLLSGLIEAALRVHAGVQVINTHPWKDSGIVSFPGIPVDQGWMDGSGKFLLQQELSDGTRLVWIPSIGPESRMDLHLGPKKISTGIHLEDSALIHGWWVQNRWLTLQIDSSNGSIRMLFLNRGGREMVHRGTWGLNQYEYVPGRDPSLAETDTLVRMRVCGNGPLLTDLELECKAPGAKILVIGYLLNNLDGSLTIRDSLDKFPVRTKEAVHFCFPFEVPDGTLEADNGAFPYRPFTDTLLGGNRDFGYVGKWMDLSNGSWGVTLCPVSTPIMEWGAMRSEIIPPGSSVSSWKKTFSPTQILFSYAMNNYWHTNYKADQSGWAVFTYVLSPHGSGRFSRSEKEAVRVTEPLISIGPASLNPPLAGDR